MVEWPLKDSVTVTARWQYLAGLGQGSPESWVCWVSVQCVGLLFPKPESRGGNGRDTPTIAPGDPLVTFLPPVPALPVVCWPKGLNSRGRNASIELEVKTAPQPPWVPHSCEPVGKEGVPVLSGVSGPDAQGETGLLLHSGAKEECVWSIGDPSQCPVIQVGGNHDPVRARKRMAQTLWE